MTQDIDCNESADTLSANDVPVETRLENTTHDAAKMRQNRTRSALHQSPLSALSDSSGACNILPTKSVQPALKTISPDNEMLPLSVVLTRKPETNAYTEDIEAHQSASFRSAESRVSSSHLQRFRIHWVTAYRVLITTTFILNAGTMGLVIGLALPITNIFVAVATNLLVSILVRQEDLINIHFGLIARIPSTTPLGLRKIIADFHHYGGIHVGCAISALLWYCFYIYAATRDCVVAAHNSQMTTLLWADIITCYIFLLLITSMCLTAIPSLREKNHNQFERIHRFGGWISLVALWIHACLRTVIDAETSKLYRSKSICILTTVTFLIILPWLRIRSVSIRAELLSTREIKLTFPYPNMPHTSTMRFSTNPLLEWHAFATIPDPDNSNASIIISAAGDWTKNILANPPSQLSLRNPATSNFLTLAPLFNSLLLVATGAGIVPLLSLLASPAMLEMKSRHKKVRVMWCVHEPFAPRWAFAIKSICMVDSSPVVFDSGLGRPQLSFEARCLAQKEAVEAVMVVSNRVVTEQVVGEVKRFGGAAYGAVFDS